MRGRTEGLAELLEAWGIHNRDMTRNEFLGELQQVTAND